MRLAIYDDGVFVREFDSDVEPVLAGKPYRKFYTVETVDPAFDSDTQVRSDWSIEEDHTAEIRRHLRTVRDKTAEELDAEKAAKAASEADKLLAQIVKRLMATQFAIVNDVRNRHGQAPITIAQYLSFFDASADGISDAQFIAKMKAML